MENKCFSDASFDFDCGGEVHVNHPIDPGSSSWSLWLDRNDFWQKFKQSKIKNTLFDFCVSSKLFARLLEKSN